MTNVVSPSRSISGAGGFTRKRQSISTENKSKVASLSRGFGAAMGDDWNVLPFVSASPDIGAANTPTRRRSDQRHLSGQKPSVLSWILGRHYIYVLDLFILLYFLCSLYFYFQIPEDDNVHHSSYQKVGESAKRTPQTPIFQFDHILPNRAATCGALDADEVTFTLALQLSDSRLWMMGHHCELWGVLAPISVAIWTSLSRAEILGKLQSMGCDVETYVTLKTISSEGHSGIEYPINKLRNLALSGVSTSHVLMIDVDFWESDDLFDSLNSPEVRTALARDPKLGVVVPAFEIQDLHNCGVSSSSKCRELHLHDMPRDFEDLVISLGSNRALPFDPMNFSRQGSTNYRRWMKQTHDELVEIPCVASDEYQPYLAVRLCDSLPPFQKEFSGHGRNHMAWILHLRRLGYHFQQLGGSFLTHFPHRSSEAKLESDKRDDLENLQLQAGSSNFVAKSPSLRNRMDIVFSEFVRWLEANVADNTRLTKCDEKVLL